MFEQYPKKRPALPKQIADIYSTHYRLNREGRTTASSLSQKMEVWLHKQVADDLATKPDRIVTTLEIGAGTLNQLQYEPDVGPYDIVEPFQALYQGSQLLRKVRTVYSDIDEISGGQRYDRITSVATFEHICDLPTIIAKCGLLLEQDGTLRVSIPSEGTLLWTLGWKLTTGLEFRIKYGLDYGLLMKHEHVNSAKEIEEALGYFFREVNHRVFGIGRSLSLYRFYACRNPKIDRCEKFRN